MRHWFHCVPEGMFDCIKVPGVPEGMFDCIKVHVIIHTHCTTLYNIYLGKQYNDQQVTHIINKIYNHTRHKHNL